MFTHLITTIISQYGVYAFAVFFILIFVETGLVFMPFLPGDSLLFMAGTFTVTSHIHPLWIILLFSLAAIAGDGLNFFLGKTYGTRLLYRPWVRRFVKDQHIERAEQFFKRYGNSAISLGRFMPIIRTLIPFTAGIGKMPNRQFVFFNIVGGIIWVTIGILAGYFFGSISFVKQHFEMIMLAIVLVSISPMLFAGIKSWWLQSRLGEIKE
ncbi:DedA family protein [Vaginisenegalia massiliensis]|uniref:DedA family protein n=1 Tax=Vaginisenegalia massiliensis TaxID=2058294 RepID=UPI000F5385A3|nr:VTT domain-containing protein [Vaginisenegalia massiliensis]